VELTITSRPARRRRATVAGLVLLSAGVLVLGYLAWEFFGTNVVAHRHQRQAIAELERSWHSGRGADAESGRVLPGDASALIRIPRFGKSYLMPVIEGTTDDVLARGIGHFTDTAQAGQEGNYALAAHRITHGEPFAELPHLRPGDTVVVETRSSVYVYVLDTDPHDLVVSHTEGWVIDPLPRNPDETGVQPDTTEGDRLITLTTCSELFHTDNRMVAFGHLVRMSTKS
jgi:sortase A